MLFALLAFVIAAAALAVIVYLFVKHWGKIRLLDPMTIKEEREREKRDAVIKRRFEHARADQLEPLKRLGRRLARSAANVYRSTYERLQTFENLYKTAKAPFSTLAPSAREQIKTLLSEARSLVRDLKWADAERRYLEVLSLDAKHPEAYKGLGVIYLKQKLFPQAKETFEFLVKMRKADDAVYAGLAEIAENDGNASLAEQMRLKAVETSPKQAFRHAELADFYLARKEPAKAWPSAKRASDLEPQSAKYLELSLQAAVELNDRAEARKRYDRLRLLSDDRSRFQSWREKVEALETKK